MRIVCLLCVLTIQLFGQTARIDQARKLYDSKKYPEAIKLLEAVEEKDKDYAAAQYYLGRIAFEQKNYDDAADYFEEASEADPKVVDYFQWLGDAYGTIARDANVIKQGILAPKMKSAWEKVIALDPKNIEARNSLVEYYTEAPGFMGGSFEKAYAMADQIKALNAAEGHRAKGSIYVKEKKIPEAEKEYQAMASANPDFKPALANFYIGQKQYDKAFAMFEESLKNNPDDMLATYQFGRACAISGQKLDRGEECLKKYLTYQPKQNEPSHGGANMRLGQILEKRGNKAEAKKRYQTALQLDGNLKEAKEGLERTSK